MKEQVVLFETSKLAKQKGFDVDYVLKPSYNEDGDLTNDDTNEFLAPTQSLLQKWLREVHNIIVFVEHETIDDSESAYTWCVKEYVPDGVEGTRKKDEPDFWKVYDSFNHNQDWWSKYEDALEKGLMKGLHVLKP